MTSPSASGPGAALSRFDRAERWLHWADAVLMGVLLVTAAALSVGPLSALVGRRALLREIHVVTGLLLPLPYLVARLGPWSARLRADVRRLAHWHPDDTRWLRSLGRDRSVRLGKFHPGQKLNAAFVAGTIPVMLVTGSIMRWFGPFPLAWRTGATFVHDWLALALAVVVVGHVAKALADGDALGGMTGGAVSARWARLHHPRWHDEVVTARLPPAGRA